MGKQQTPAIYKLQRYTNDLNRMDGFSQDYLDVKDLGRTEAPHTPHGAYFLGHLSNKANFKGVLPNRPRYEGHFPIRSSFRGLAAIPCDPLDLNEFAEITSPDCLINSSGKRYPYRV